MRVGFLLPGLEPSGGTAVVLDHARRLHATARFDVELLITGSEASLPPQLGDVPVFRVAEARGRSYDVAVATWWETAAALYDVTAPRRCVFLQSIEHRFYEEGDLFERIGAASILGLPVDFVAVASWMRDLVAELRPDATCEVVLNGIDKSIFAPRVRAPAGGPLRVLVEGQPSLWFKGVDDAVRAVRGMREPAHLTVVCLDPREGEGLDADRVVGGLSPAAMADLYAESDVLVKLARVEGLGLAPLEAFHVGVPCVLTPYTGHDEYARHGDNALIAGFDDGPGTTAALDALARDRDLLARLGDGAAATAADWPSAEASSQRLAGALEAIVGAEPPSEVTALAHLHRTLAFYAGVGRHRVGAGEWARLRVPELEASRDELLLSREECADLLQGAEEAIAQAEERIVEITSSRGYRAMATVRETLNRVRP